MAPTRLDWYDSHGTKSNVTVTSTGSYNVDADPAIPHAPLKPAKRLAFACPGVAPMSELSIKPEGDQGMIRIRADRPGERAVSILVTTEQAIQVLEELAGLIGYTVTPTASSTSTDL